MRSAFYSVRRIRRPRPRTLAVLLLLCVVLSVTLWPEATQSDALLRRITNTPETAINLNPAISGNGKRIAFESSEDLTNTGGASGFHSFQVDLNNIPISFERIALSRTVAPGISQDGSRIAFASTSDPLGRNADGNSEIFICDGGVLWQITETQPRSDDTRIQDGSFQPSLTDDGKFIAFSSNRNFTNQNGDNNLEAFLYDTTTKTFTQITNSSGTAGVSNVKISGDATHVAYVRDDRDLVLYTRQTNAVLVIASNANNLSITNGRSISDDGTRVVYSLETATNTTQ